MKNISEYDQLISLIKSMFVPDAVKLTFLFNIILRKLLLCPNKLLKADTWDINCCCQLFLAVLVSVSVGLSLLQAVYIGSHNDENPKITLCIHLYNILHDKHIPGACPTVHRIVACAYISQPDPFI